MQTLVEELKIFVRYFLFWVFLCFIDRLIFIAVFFSKIGWSNFSDVFRIYYHGLALDFSVAAYICAIPFLFYSILTFFPKVSGNRKFLDAYTIIIIVLFFVVSLANVNIYREWGDKISKRAIDAIYEEPMGAAASAESTPVLFPVITIVSGIVLSYLLYLRLFRNLKFRNLDKAWKIGLMFFFGAMLLFTFIRGGYGRAPLNPSKAYFSHEAYYNHAAVNTHYALLREYFTRNQRRKSPYRYFQDEQERLKIITPVFAQQPDSAVQILSTQRPNIVLLVLESFTADLIQSLGGEKGITPNMEKFFQQGVLFDRVYAASDRSDKGIVGVFSGFPGQGPESIIKYIDKHENMPAMGQELHDNGYSTAFYHGGQSEFYNFKSYMLTHGIEKVVDVMDFNPLEDRNSWGVYDHVVFNRMLEDLKTEKKPFFYSMFTLVNHEPFSLKGTYKFGHKDNAAKFRSTAYYTDSVLMDFIEKAKHESWYPNTLFIMVADHGHRLPSEKYDITHPNRFHIPLLFFGEIIKPEYRGQKIHKLGNQTDLISTLFHQLGISSERYHWSRNLLNPTLTDVAFYNSKNSFGIIAPEQAISFDHIGNSLNYIQDKNYPSSQTDSLLNISKAYYQEVYSEFMKY